MSSTATGPVHVPHDTGLASLLDAVDELADHVATGTVASVATALPDLQQLLCDLSMSCGAVVDPERPCGVRVEQPHDSRRIDDLATSFRTEDDLRHEVGRTCEAVSVAATQLPPGSVDAGGGCVCTGDFLDAWAAVLRRQVGPRR